MPSRKQDTRRNARTRIIEETREILKTLETVDQIAVLIFAVWKLLSIAFTPRTLLYMYAVLIPAITVILIPKSTPFAWVIQIGWGSLVAIGLVLMLRHRPREKYHYIKKNYEEKRQTER